MKLFKKEIGPIKIWWLLSILLVSFVFIVIGSFFDLSISKNIASMRNIYAILIESFGTLLGCILAPISVAIVTKKVFTSNDSKRWHIVLGIICAILSIIGPALFNAKVVSGQDGYSWHFNFWIGALIGVIVYTIAYLIAYYLVDETLDMKLLLKNALILLIGFALTAILFNFVLKGLIYRPRYRALAWDNEKLDTQALGFSYYKDWWAFAFYIKPKWFTNSNLPDDYIKSWPSAHTAVSSCLLLMPFATMTFKKTNKKLNNGIFIFSIINTVLIAIGRMIAGAHYLSDVSCALFLSIFTLFIPAIIINKIFLNKEKQ